MKEWMILVLLSATSLSSTEDLYVAKIIKLIKGRNKLSINNNLQWYRYPSKIVLSNAIMALWINKREKNLPKFMWSLKMSKIWILFMITSNIKKFLSQSYGDLNYLMAMIKSIWIFKQPVSKNLIKFKK